MNDVSHSKDVGVAVVGGGAAGLATAIFAAERLNGRARVAVLDGAQRIGAKILVSGGGRCNVTHEKIVSEDYCGSRNIVRNVLRSFDEQRTLDWFASLGVELKREDTGKMFPVTDSARTVVEALLRRCEQLGVEILTEHRVKNVRCVDEGFVIEHDRGQIRAERVVMATGGKSLPKTGSDGAGWSMIKRLGHSVSDTWAALVPLVLEEKFFHSNLSGISHEAELSTFVDGRLIDRRTGSLLWTHFGISGPLAMDASRFWVIAEGRGESPELRCSFLPGRAFADVERLWIDAAAKQPRVALGTVLKAELPRRIIETLCVSVGLEPGHPIGHVSRELRREFVHTLTNLQLPVMRDRGWNYAEVTAGGVPLSEIQYNTMMSRKVPGLYLVGEILDCDGRIGGFNFQWAWSTGYIAGQAIAATY